MSDSPTPTRQSPSDEAPALRVEAWVDLVCPWSYIGLSNLLAAVQRFSDERPESHVLLGLRSYELNPNADDDDTRTEAQHLADVKGITVEHAATELDRVAAVAADAGLDFRFDRLQQSNTGLAHELLHAARVDHREREIALALFHAHFSAGRHIGRLETLEQIAGEQGLDVASISRELTTRSHTGEVQADERRAAELGISSVPFFLCNDRYGVSGAQPVEALLEVLHEVQTRVAADAN
ncbi:DsbA family oxidoreductase [Pseudoclavibacter sp. 13-3]|uniref:DsbA family oxidoreductase n=1 Tax=Pseudoclavibacter sp. 13-3 TaxID=2901228 RepID=UPI001E43B5AF|nr:DsbA family oxidoreductase [Pseudoclavibacter sp. 13-3]MCD7100654.1 DsbA family oxidoreductase [Pseudoclavibacter sp. 13-3]